MSKPYLDYQQQIQKLKDEKGLIISNESYAEEWLTNIGYFSLIGGYKNLFINPMIRKYETPTMFEDIVALYQFDESLRQLTFAYRIKVEHKELGLRSNSKEYKNLAFMLTGDPVDAADPAEVFAYGVESAKGGASNRLSDAIYRQLKGVH